MKNINAYKPYRAGSYPQFSSSENRCTHVAKNPKGKYIRQFQVDGGVFSKGKEPKRCDYLLLDDTDQRSYYIELKGSDVTAAIEQIESTISLIGSSLKNYKIYCRIVYRTATQRLYNSRLIKWKSQRNAIIKSNCLEETL